MRSSTWLRPEKSQSIVRGQGFESPHLHDIPCSGNGCEREVQLPGGSGVAPRSSSRVLHVGTLVVARRARRRRRRRRRGRRLRRRARTGRVGHRGAASDECAGDHQGHRCSLDLVSHVVHLPSRFACHRVPVKRAWLWILRGTTERALGGAGYEPARCNIRTVSIVSASSAGLSCR